MRRRASSRQPESGPLALPLDPLEDALLVPPGRRAVAAATADDATDSDAVDGDEPRARRSSTGATATDSVYDADLRLRRPLPVPSGSLTACDSACGTGTASASGSAAADTASESVH